MHKNVVHFFNRHPNATAQQQVEHESLLPAIVVYSIIYNIIVRTCINLDPYFISFVWISLISHRVIFHRFYLKKNRHVLMGREQKWAVLVYVAEM